MRCSTSRTRVPMAFPTRGVRPLDRVWSQFVGVEERNVEPISPLCTPRRARRSAERHRDPRWSLSTRTSLAGFERRCDLSQPGRPYVGPTAPTDRLRRRHGLPLCVRVVPAATSEASAVEQILDDLARSARDERLELVLVDRALRSRRPSDSRTNSTTKFAEWDGRAPHAMSTGPKSFVPSVTLGASRWPTAISCVGDVWRAASKTRDFGHRVVARCLIAEVLRRPAESDSRQAIHSSLGVSSSFNLKDVERGAASDRCIADVVSPKARARLREASFPANILMTTGLGAQ